MQIFCPTCREGYRIPVERVPKTARMVVCNSCGMAWKQFFDQQPKPVGRTSAPKAFEISSLKRPTYSKVVLKILHEEAALEAKLRA